MTKESFSTTPKLCEPCIIDIQVTHRVSQMFTFVLMENYVTALENGEAAVGGYSTKLMVWANTQSRR